MYSSIPAVDVPAAAPAPKRSYTRLAAVPAVMALLSFAGVAGYSQLKAERVVTPARGMVTASKTDHVHEGVDETRQDRHVCRCFLISERF